MEAGEHSDNHVKNLRFGFATTGLTLDKPMDTSDLDILWLFYYDGDTPMVCAYNQDTDSVLQTSTVRSSKWRLLLPYFDRIACGDMEASQPQFIVPIHHE